MGNVFNLSCCLSERLTSVVAVMQSQPYNGAADATFCSSLGQFITTLEWFTFSDRGGVDTLV